MKPVNLGVLISGRGSNLQAVHEAIGSGALVAEIRVVISNKEQAPGLARAREQGLNGIFLNPKQFADTPNPREEYDRALVQLLQKADVELVILAGYMRIVTPILIHAYPWRIMNIHPSLLPAFPGLNAQQQALDWGVKVSGCTVHFVTEGVDEGPIIRQAAVPVLEDDTVDSLSARILEQEHRILPEAIQLFAEGRLRVEGRRVRVRESDCTHGCHQSDVR